jgi:hypothetical protein
MGLGLTDIKAEEFNNKFLLAKDNEEQKAWYLAPNKTNSAALDELYMWAYKAKIHFKIKPFFPKNIDRKNALRHVEGKEHIRESEKLNAIELTKKHL